MNAVAHAYLTFQMLTLPTIWIQTFLYETWRLKIPFLYGGIKHFFTQNLVMLMPHQWCHISVMAPHWELVCLFVQQLILLGKYQSSAWLGVLRSPETPLTKGQWWGKCFRIMTLSCANFKHRSTFELSWACLYRTYFIYTIFDNHVILNSTWLNVSVAVMICDDFVLVA